MNSIATLSAEKSRMEASFQADKKNMRQEMALKDKEIKDLTEKLKNITLNLNMEKENFKAKIINQERILTDERHLKENLETQLNQLKTQFSQTSNSDKVIQNLNQELSEFKRKVKVHESSHSKSTDDSSVLQALQSEMESLKQQHIANLTMEKQRANDANEKSRLLTALHEERVQCMEARLSDLSVSVAHYHNLRETDQRSISHLKEKIAQLSRESEEFDESKDRCQIKFPNLQTIIDEIERLKHVLIYENTKLENPVGKFMVPNSLQNVFLKPIVDFSDLSFILPHSSKVSGVTFSEEKYFVLKQDCERYKNENELLKLQLSDQIEHIKTLQDKVQVLNLNIDDYENEIKNKSMEINNELKAERNKWRETVNSMEVDHRSKISQLEQQLQKQRERSLTLLEEKEIEIRSLKTSYELFLPKKQSVSSHPEEDDGQYSESSDKRRTSHHLGMVLNQPPNSASLPETHMIYYSNELARKEMELSSIRKAKREAESLIRQTLKEKIMLQEDLDDRIMQLEQQVDR